MRHLALTVIQDEHRALAAMLSSMRMMVERTAGSDDPVRFDVLRAMLFYIDEFPERLHHTKESALLFPKVRARVPGLGPVLDALDQDHGRGEARVRELGHLLLAWEILGEPRRAPFAKALATYVDAYLRHMGTEESEVLPAARRELSDGDWAELDAAFAANADPLTGHPASDVFKPLFQRIVMTAPAPIGLG